MIARGRVSVEGLEGDSAWQDKVMELMRRVMRRFRAAA